MQLTEVSSSSNAVLKLLRKLPERSERRKAGLFLLEGRRLISEALARSLQVSNVVMSESFAQAYLESDHSEKHLWEGIEAAYVVKDSLFKHLYTTATSCGIVATAPLPQWSFDDCFRQDKTLLVVGESIQDPGNLGTIIRSAYAFQSSGLLLTIGSVDAYSPKVVRSSMGATFDVVIVQDLDLNQLVKMVKSRGLEIFALDSGATSSYWETAMSEGALFFGNEGNGLSEAAKSQANALLKIPMQPQSESLNVAVAVGIVVADAYRRRSAEASR